MYNHEQSSHECQEGTKILIFVHINLDRRDESAGWPGFGRFSEPTTQSLHSRNTVGNRPSRPSNATISLILPMEQKENQKVAIKLILATRDQLSLYGLSRNLRGNREQLQENLGNVGDDKGWNGVLEDRSRKGKMVPAKGGTDSNLPTAVHIAANAAAVVATLSLTHSLTHSLTQ